MSNPPCYDFKKNDQNMNTAQLEFSLTNARPLPGHAPRQRRLSRANWWFKRMRQIVDRACDWQPAPPARPEQIWFATDHPQAATTPQPNPEERQICE